jgi:hypothetical protein
VQKIIKDRERNEGVVDKKFTEHNFFSVRILSFSSLQPPDRLWRYLMNDLGASHRNGLSTYEEAELKEVERTSKYVEQK